MAKVMEIFIYQNFRGFFYPIFKNSFDLKIKTTQMYPF